MRSKWPSMDSRGSSTRSTSQAPSSSASTRSRSSSGPSSPSCRSSRARNGHRAEKALRHGYQEGGARSEAAKTKAFKNRATENGTTSAFERAASLATMAGKGYDAGIEGYVSATKAASEKTGERIHRADGVKRADQSPSKRFAMLGDYSAAGFEKGLRRGSPDVGNAVDDMIRIPSRRDAPTIAASGGRRHAHDYCSRRISPSIAERRTAPRKRPRRRSGQKSNRFCRRCSRGAIDNMNIQSGGG